MARRTIKSPHYAGYAVYLPFGDCSKPFTAYFKWHQHAVIFNDDVLGGKGKIRQVKKSELAQMLRNA